MNWLPYYCVLYVQAGLAFALLAPVFSRMAPAAAAEARPLREAGLSFVNLLLWAFSSLIIAYLSFYYDYPKFIALKNSWFFHLLERLHLDFSLPPESMVSDLLMNNSVPWLFYPLWFAFMILVADMAFYWTHRLMHIPRLYQSIHLTHHRFTRPTAWCGFAFHLSEGALLCFATVLIPYLLMPIEPGIGVILNVTTAGWAAFVHSGCRTPGWDKHFLLRHVYTPHHHQIHHARGDHNFGLYFNWWDRAFGTEVVE
jgi:sterol desaturase/sphingolipid hydroxylase (fatty acid hydroxylase superfamily)